ncbi:MAG: Ig-like domain-containing protein [Candidatus Thorarchaeota archaeon]|jgi:endonuclease/exonuclease/phosphatase family metal-dependent hydrolase
MMPSDARRPTPVIVEVSDLNNRNVAVVLLFVLLVASVGIAFMFLLGPAPPEERNVRPQVTLTSPTNGLTVSGTVTINASIIDDESLDGDIYIDGTLVAAANSYQWDTSAYPDGRHSIRVDAVDSSGLDDSDSVEVTVDNVAESLLPFSDTFNIMLYNIKESGLNDDWLTVTKDINPDLMVIVETGIWDDDSNEGLNAAVSELNVHFANENPYDGYCTQGSHFPTTGEAILSRFPVKSLKQIGVVPLDDESTYSVTHAFIEAVVDINGTDVYVFGGHLKASDGDDNIWRREREMEGMINYMDSLGDVPILYLSDQNSYSPYDVGSLEPQGMDLGYGPMTMMMNPDDPTYGQYSSAVHNFTDVFRTLNSTDPGYSYGHQDLYTSIRIDYVIVNSFFEDMIVNCTVIDDPPAHTASDHYAIETFIRWNTSSVSEPASLENRGSLEANSQSSSPQLKHSQSDCPTPLHLALQRLSKELNVGDKGTYQLALRLVQVF